MISKNNYKGGNKNKYQKWRSRIIDFLLILFARVPFDEFPAPEPKVIKTHEDFRRIQSLLESFKKDNKSYPTTEEGLDALLRNPNSEKYPNYQQYIQSLPLDSCGIVLRLPLLMYLMYTPLRLLR